MNLKKLLKYFKKNESNVSMVLGVVVILIVGFFIVKNYNSTEEGGETIPPIGTEQVTPEEGTYTVQQGDDLWKIAEDKLGTGYDWKRIADLNNIEAPYNISAGQELKIPAKISEVPTEAMAMEQTSPTEAPTETILPTQTPAEQMQAEVTPTTAPEQVMQTQTSISTISGDSYTVVHGDNLWNIAVRAYGDGFKWTEIAKANNLSNPSIIHAGNHFVIPR